MSDPYYDMYDPSTFVTPHKNQSTTRNGGHIQRFNPAEHQPADTEGHLDGMVDLTENAYQKKPRQTGIDHGDDDDLPLLEGKIFT